MRGFAVILLIFALNVSANTPAPAPVPKPSAQTDILSQIVEDYNYDPTGKRDPFLPFTAPKPIKLGAVQGPLLPLQRFDLDQLKVIGIIWNVRKPKAMIIDPSGAGHVIGPQSRIGRNNGYVQEIREGEIIVVEPLVKDGNVNYLTRIMKIQKKQ
jgi:type IV pilus assembly protein PilP